MKRAKPKPQPPAALFTAADEARRTRLRALGWVDCGEGWWRRPTGLGRVREEEAFAWLDSLPKGDSHG
jgi:hypothetical protein